MSVIALLALLAARGMAWLSLDDIPHVMDEITYELQAQMYAAGRLHGPEVRPLSAFHQWFVEDRGMRYGIFPPGWPAVLALGHLLAVPGLVAPALHGLTSALLGGVVRRLAGSGTGLLAAGLYGFCPQAVLLAATRMSHTLAALLTLLALAPLITRLFAAAEKRQSTAEIAGAGAALGWLWITRPLCALVISGVMVVGLGECARRGKVYRADWVALPGPLLLVAALGLYNQALTGSALQFTQNHYFDTHAPPFHAPGLFRYGPGCNALGFGPGHGCEVTPGGEGHTISAGIDNTLLNLRVWFRLAAAGGLLVIPVLGALYLRCRWRWAALFLASPLLLSAIAYSAYWYPGTCYGARFFHVGLPGFIMAAGLGYAALERLSLNARRLARVLGGFTALFFSLSLGLAHTEVSRAYWGTDSRFVRFARQYKGPDAVFLVAFRSHGLRVPEGALGWTAVPIGGWSNGVRILAAQLANDPFLEGPVVFGRFHPAIVPLVRREFPGRELFLYVMADNPQDDSVLPLDEAEAKRVAAQWEMPVINFDGVVIRTTPPGRAAAGSELTE